MNSFANKNEHGRKKHADGISLAVCILFYEKLDQTKECIQSFLPSEVNIYVLNNGSSVSSRKALGDFCRNYKQVKIIDSDVNLGVGPGRNKLISNTEEEWLLFVDNDIVIKTPDWLQKFQQHISSNSEIEVFIPRLFNTHEKRYVSYRSIRIVGMKILHDVIIVDNVTNSFPGGAAFVNRRVFDRLGLYDEKMIVGFEDVELCVRAILLGDPVEAKIIDDIELIHNHRKTGTTEDKEAVRQRYNASRIESSYNRITEKYNLMLVSYWRTWIAEQLQATTEKRFSLHKLNWKQLVPKAVRRVGSLQYQRMKGLRGHAVPKSCSLFMTDRCNLKCSFCYRSVIGVKNSKEMTLSVVEKVLSLYPSLDAFCIAGLGEPTLCSGFSEVINFLKTNKKYVGVITNGINIDSFEGLVSAPDYISISLKGHDNSSYVANAGVAAYEKVMENFLKLKAEFKNVGFSYILTKNRYMDVAKVIEICDDVKPEFLHLTNYLAYNTAVADESQKIITVKDKEIIDYINEVCGKRNYVRVKPIYLNFDDSKFNCWSYDYVINLDGEGNIGGCQRQIPPDASFGNIFESEDPYNSPAMRGIRSQIHKGFHAHEECRHCFGRNA